jgi:hypothetical protein
MKILLILQALFLTLAISAQQTDSLKIKASDPTQLYTFVEGYGGLNFLSMGNTGLDIDTWQFGFRGSWAIKRFLIGIELSSSNNVGIQYVFDDIHIHTAYQVHNNTGLYNATVLRAGYTSPSVEVPFIGSYLYFRDYAVYPNNSIFSKYYFTYQGALKFSEKFSIYPEVQYSRRTLFESYVTIFPDSSYEQSRIESNGWTFSGTFSYDINPNNFLQLYVSWSVDNWTGKYGSSPEENDLLSTISENRFAVNLKYQHAFTPFSQAYIKLLYHDYLLKGENLGFEIDQSPTQRLYSFQLGFIYFLH